MCLRGLMEKKAEPTTVLGLRIREYMIQRLY